MKKIILFSLASIILLTGCDLSATDTLSCTLENTAGSLTTKVNYNIDYENDTVKKVRIMYDYNQTTARNQQTDGVGTGTDGTTNDTQADEDGIIDGVVGETFNDLLGGMTDIILDVAGLKDRHATIQNNYNNINGFSVGNTTDTDNNYTVNYVIDYDQITDNDLARLNLSRDLTTLKNNYISQGFTCK